MPGKTLGMLLAVTCLLSLTLTAVQAEEGTLLRFKFLPGQVETYSLQVIGEGQMELLGLPNDREMKSPLKIEMSLPLDLITDEVDEQGHARLRAHLGALDMRVIVAGHNIHTVMNPAAGTVTVTADGNVVPIPAGWVLPIQGLENMVVTLTPQGQLAGVEGLEQLPAVMTMGLMGGVNREQMLALMQGQAPLLSENPVRPGDSWEQTLTFPWPEDKPTTAVTTYTFQELETVDGEPLARLALTSSLELRDVPLPEQVSPTGASGAAGPPPGGKSRNLLNLLRVDSSGEITLPLEGGYLHSADLDVTLNLETTRATSQDPQASARKMLLKDLRLKYRLTPRY